MTRLHLFLELDDSVNLYRNLRNAYDVQLRSFAGDEKYSEHLFKQITDLVSSIKTKSAELLTHVENNEKASSEMKEFFRQFNS
jgi:hypothetical protein